MLKIPTWLKPSRTVPHAPWSAKGTVWKAKPSTFLIVALGLWLCGTGDAFIYNAGLGQSPWTVLAQGISKVSGITIGWSAALISAFVLLLWIPLKRKLGIATLMNVVLCASALQVMAHYLPMPANFTEQVFQIIIGVGFFGFGTAVYIPAHLGTGPRDGLMTGLHFRTGQPVARIRLTIEIVVMAIGWLLGGKVGLGTVIFATTIGYAVAFWFKAVHRLDTAQSKKSK